MRSTERHRAGSAVAELESTTADSGVTIGVFAGFDSAGRFLVDPQGGGEPRVALSVVGLSLADLGRRVVVGCERGDVTRPIILGVIQDERANADEPVKADSDRLVIKAKQEIELRCGDASIVLTRAGKVLIRGTYVVSRSKGANKIKGAFVNIN